MNLRFFIFVAISLIFIGCGESEKIALLENQIESQNITLYKIYI